MVRLVPVFLPAFFLGFCLESAVAEPSSGMGPTIYELMINGESFQIEAHRLVKLQSTEKPGVTYNVALRVAPTQRLRLNTVEFDFDWLTRISEDPNRAQRTVRLTHELGFEMLVTDWGESVEPQKQEEILKTLTQSVAETFREQKFKTVTVSEPHKREFPGAKGQGTVIHYVDEQDLGHTCLIYLLEGPKFTVSCLVQYLDNDLEDVKGMVKKTLDSFRPARRHLTPSTIKRNP